MTRVYGEPVEVRVAADGGPARFAWRGRRYTVRFIAEHWVVNRDWWREPDTVPVRPDLRFWRVEAASAHGSGGRGGDTGTYELRQDMADGTWTLRRVAD